MSAALLVLGWALAAGLAFWVVRLRARLSLVADAEHELRGAFTAFAMAAARATGVRSVLMSELHRARSALADLTAARGAPVRERGAGPAPLEPVVRAAALAWGPAARRGGGVEVDWRAGAVTPRASAGRVAQVVGNLVSNAVEHGTGVVRVEAARRGGSVSLEVSNAAGSPRSPKPGRGRGLRIAARAARDAGGTLTVAGEHDRVRAHLKLPVMEP